MTKATKTSQLQIRVTPGQKAELARRARAEGMDLSGWVLSRLLPEARQRFAALVQALAAEPGSKFVLAEIGDMLNGLGPAEFPLAVDELPRAGLDELSGNQLAAMVEARAAQLRARPPSWTCEIPPLKTPWFPTALLSLRLHLLCNSPSPYRRRNMFVDSALGDRV